MAVVKFWFRAATSALLAVAAAAAFAEDPTERLEQRLQDLDGVVARFEQRITDAQGFLIEEASGTLHLAKPRFRWEVADPFPQIILADGDRVQIYDPDLEQVTEREVGGALHEAPLALLTKEDLELAQHFGVELTEDGVDRTRFSLTPLSDDALFASMQLVFSGDALSVLTIFDHSGQETLIRFEQYQPSQVIQSDVFELELPPGTDFVRG